MILRDINSNEFDLKLSYLPFVFHGLEMLVGNRQHIKRRQPTGQFLPIFFTKQSQINITL